MRVHSRHPWDLTPEQAIALQRRLAEEVILEQRSPGDPRAVARIGLSPPDKVTGLVRGAVVVFSLPDLEVVDVATAEDKPTFPYVPGLLSFRESPALVMALERLTITPDLLLMNGKGPRIPGASASRVTWDFSQRFQQSAARSRAWSASMTR
jgi:deoxyribonuclease V